MKEPEITINGHRLSEGQAMAVRVAVTGFMSESLTPERRADIGPVADGYHARLTEVLRMFGVLG